ncbi:YncE family protein [Amycolatopsis cihanbeyliensis]|uniref:DNA-binding beta-propeller fold protein YncE n=1 Tax=Amycolatopsis cihanbeyliensis TaxID=1128664 RepID=A0A542DJK7_AMYCI|nr:YncE family protein [Amycolatopsis cihanbeyliensis]TQJ03278.1 DNA-binding beta-propeller fold protein YncE [Amycolatopsis cihanbeyliensis]
MRTATRSLIIGAAAVLACAVPAGQAAAAEVVTIPVGDRPTAVAVNSATNTVYVADAGGGTVTIVDGDHDQVRDTVSLGSTVTDIAVNQVTNRVYASNRAGGSVSVLDGDTGAVLTTIAAGRGTAVLGVDEATDRVYAASATTGDIAVIEGDTGAVTATVPGHRLRPAGMAVDSGRETVYVTGETTDELVPLDVVTNTSAEGVRIGRAPAGVGVHEASNTIYVANAGIHHLSVVDGSSRTERETILLRSAGSAIAVHQRTHTVYTNGGPNGLARIDGSGGELVDELSLGINPGGVAVSQHTGAVYVTDPLHDSLMVVTEF